MNARWDVLGLGVVAVDDLFFVDHHPLPDTKVQVRAQARYGGGQAGTALVAASRLGVRAAYCGVLGEDELSRYTIRELEREGVDCSLVRRREDARPFYSVVVVDRSTGQRSILYSTEGFREVTPEDLSADLIAQCRVLFVDYGVVDSGLRAAALARAHGIPVVADIEKDDHPRLLELVRCVDHLIVGVELATHVTGEADPAVAVRALAGERACCVVTAGSRGVWYCVRGGEVRHQPAFPVSVVDTTGCGDVFHGAYMACLARGEAPDRCIRTASAVAALKATKPGGRAGIPDWDTVQHFLAEQA